MATQFLKPYSFVLTNLPIEFDDEGKAIGASYKNLKGLFGSFGCPVEWVEPGWTKNGFHGYVIIQVGKSPEAFKAAYTVEKMFEKKGQGRDGWLSDSEKGKKPYLWVARKEDHHFFYKVQKKAKGGIFVKPKSVPSDWLEAEGATVQQGIVEGVNITLTFEP